MLPLSPPCGRRYAREVTVRVASTPLHKYGVVPRASRRPTCKARDRTVLGEYREGVERSRCGCIGVRMQAYLWSGVLDALGPVEDPGPRAHPCRPRALGRDRRHPLGPRWALDVLPLARFVTPDSLRLCHRQVLRLVVGFAHRVQVLDVRAHGPY